MGVISAGVWMISALALREDVTGEGVMSWGYNLLKLRQDLPSAASWRHGPHFPVQHCGLCAQSPRGCHSWSRRRL